MAITLLASGDGTANSYDVTLSNIPTTAKTLVIDFRFSVNGATAGFVTPLNEITDLFFIDNGSSATRVLDTNRSSFSTSTSHPTRVLIKVPDYSSNTPQGISITAVAGSATTFTSVAKNGSAVYNKFSIQTSSNTIGVYAYEIWGLS